MNIISPLDALRLFARAFGSPHSKPVSQDAHASYRKWHEVNPPLFPVKLENGRRSSHFGTLWRRWDGKSWVYKQDDETPEEWGDRQW
ncbi:MAG TPA: hypothetical protein VGO22_19120 [Pseudorhizobium sp.]|jgi:hypothetical protein|nr:hypothetical protein [Pseudorhizobium sp.]